MNRFRAPTAFDKASGQIIEYFGMARPIAHEPKVRWRAHNARAKVIVPNAVDRYPGSERIRRAGNRLRQLQTTRTLSKWFAVRKHSEETPGYFLA